MVFFLWLVTIPKWIWVNWLTFIPPKIPKFKPNSCIYVAVDKYMLKANSKNKMATPINVLRLFEKGCCEGFCKYTR